MRILASLAFAALLVSAAAVAEEAKPANAAKPAAAAATAGDKMVIDMKGGKVVIKLRPDLAPSHVARAKELAGKGFYDGLKWHRVMEGFMAQTGDPSGTGASGSQLPNLKAEFSKEPFKRGTVGAARTSDPNTANSQFFICFTDTGCAGLNGQYTVWGQVVEGMDVIDKVKRGAPGSGTVSGPDTMGKVSIQ